MKLIIYLSILIKVVNCDFDIDYENEPFPLFQNKCIEDLGCFYTGPPFYHPIHRPKSVAPTDDLRTKFNLYTPENPREPQILSATEESMNDSTINPEYPTKVIIHGYRMDLDEEHILFMIKDELLREGQYNVIVVNWTANNKSPYYQAVANARAVGAQVAKFINFHVMYKGFKAQDFHIIGHSLGGQMTGWVGERIPGLGRITGLDPAGPYFQKAENSVRLDKTDATFVDIIHSNGGGTPVGGYGIHEAIGHADFYPNGGQKQPGCFDMALNTTQEEYNASIDNMVASSCSHARAVDFFLTSIKQCQFLSLQCSSYSSFSNGECTAENSAVSPMGFKAKKPEGDNSLFYLDTGIEAPFCLD